MHDAIMATRFSIHTGQPFILLLYTSGVFVWFLTGVVPSVNVPPLVVGVVTGLVVATGLYPVAHDAPTLSQGLRTQAWPLLI